ncbi:MAG: hypothetical protein IKW66_05245, partial [Clostridia bacterium]|nr:hypothetical protein [Clostridia bacterium]
LDDGDKWCLCDKCFEAFLTFLGCEGDANEREEKQEEKEPTCIGYAKDGSCLYMGSGRYGCDGRREECPLPDDVKARMKEVGL